MNVRSATTNIQVNIRRNLAPASTTRCLFFSHDGYGLGHFRRNSLVARALLERDPAATAVLVTGLPFPLPWTEDRRLSVVRIPPLLKDSDGAYRAPGIGFEQALGRRADGFAAAVRAFTPHVIVVDRHPYGIAGELRAGLEEARGRGARLVVGLRDILDAPEVVAEELSGEGWSGVEELFDEAFVYGGRHVCDHEREYGLPLPPRYCGWVVDPPRRAARVPRLLSAAAGGGGDGGPVFSLAVQMVERLDGWRCHLAAGPYADVRALHAVVGRSPARERITVDTGVDTCGPLFARSSAVVQMAGYNSTVEALAAGHRPILVPRSAPRREQAIRAERLARLGLCDAVAEDASADAVAALLLARPRRLRPGSLPAAGIDLAGAAHAAGLLTALAAGIRR